MNINSGVTSINDLPSSGSNNTSQLPIQTHNNNNNIIMNTMDHISQPTSQMQIQMPGQLHNPVNHITHPMETRNNQNTIQPEQTNYNELVCQLQQAVQRGATNLPSRDIPIDHNKIVNDPNIKPNFIPTTNNQNYIQNDMSVNDLINEDNNNVNTSKKLEHLFIEFKIPILIGLLFFIFQIPTFKKIIKTSLPFLNSKDGNNNIYTYIYNTLLFVTSFYLLNKIIDNMTNYVI